MGTGKKTSSITELRCCAACSMLQLLVLSQKLSLGLATINPKCRAGDVHAVLATLPHFSPGFNMNGRNSRVSLVTPRIFLPRAACRTCGSCPRNVTTPFPNWRATIGKCPPFNPLFCCKHYWPMAFCTPSAGLSLE
jgi:hypothetical protein